MEIKILFRDFADSDFLYNAIWDRAERLSRFYDRIMACQVVMSAPHRHQYKGRKYHVQIRLQLPGRFIVVSRESERDLSHENAYLAIHDAFRAARRELEDDIRLRRRQSVKEGAVPTRALVQRIFPDDGYGFLVTPENREIYFHENSVLHNKFRTLQTGDEVIFHEEMGEKGPQATTVRPTGRNNHRFMELLDRVHRRTG